MAESIKFTNKYVDTTGIYDSALQTTQAELNSKAVTVDLTSASIGTPNPVNADTLGGDPASDFFKSAKVVNNFTTTASGYALDARAGKSLNDSLNTIGTATYSDTETVSTPSGSFTTIATIRLATAGTYIITGDIMFGNDTNGIRILLLNETETSNNDVNNSVLVTGRATLNKTRIVVASNANTVYYLRAYQNSGNAINCNGRIRAVRLK